MRSANHRLVRVVMRTLQRAKRSPDSGSFPAAASIILSAACDRMPFGESLEGWPIASVESVVLAFALAAPSDDLRRMAETARSQYSWLEWWDRPGGGCDQAQGFAPHEAAA